MAMFTDGPLASLEDLRQYDSSILDSAAAEGVDLAAKLQISQREVGLEVTLFLLRNDIYLGPGRELTTVLVTEALVHAQCLHALELTYRDAYNNQLNDRFGGKAKEYASKYKQAMSVFTEIGVAVVDSPVGKAVGGTFSYVPGGSLGDSTYFLMLRWVNEFGAVGAASNVSVVQCPSGTLPTATCPLPLEVAGWHVFTGTSEALLHRQTVQALSGGAIWTLQPQGIRTDLPNLPELAPSRHVQAGRRLRRG